MKWSPCLRTFRRPPAVAPRARQEGYRVTLEDAKGRVLETALVEVRFIEADPEHATFGTRLAYRANARRVVLYRGDARLSTFPVVSGQPRFALIHPTHQRDIDPEGCVHVKWRATARKRLTYHIRFSANGTTWFRLAVNLQKQDHVLDLRPLPGGRRCRLQIIATNGYHTQYVELPRFALPGKSPELLTDGLGGPVLFVQGYSYEEGPIVGEAIVWHCDGRAVASGGRFDVRQLREGVHEIAVALSLGGEERRREVLGLYDCRTGRIASHRG